MRIGVRPPRIGTRPTVRLGSLAMGGASMYMARRRGWAWGRRRRRFGLLRLILGLVILGIFAFFVCSFLGLLTLSTLWPWP